MGEVLLKLFPYFLGGIGGTVLTVLFNTYKGRIQKMYCYYIDEDIMSKLPIRVQEGIVHNNIYTKQFLLTNTTNIDYTEFRVIFEFDSTAKILRHTDISKTGANKFKKKLLKDNEYSITIRNFNRGDQVKFIFEIANVSHNYVNVTEDNCTGFKICFKDKRTNKIKSKLTFVSKEEINSDSPARADL